MSLFLLCLGLLCSLGGCVRVKVHAEDLEVVDHAVAGVAFGDC